MQTKTREERRLSLYSCWAYIPSLQSRTRLQDALGIAQSRGVISLALAKKAGLDHMHIPSSIPLLNLT